MKFCCMLLTALVWLPGAAWSQENKPEVPGQSNSSIGAGAGQAGAQNQASPNSPGKPAKKELDVSAMPFDAESIRQVVKFHMPEIQECYEKVLADTGKKIEGRVFVNFVIDANGNVSDAKALKRSTLKDDRVVDCVLAMRAWYFPKPKDNRDHPIEYPFELKVKP